MEVNLNKSTTTSVDTNYQSTAEKAAEQTQQTNETEKNENAAGVYEKGLAEDKKATYAKDTESIKKYIADAERKMAEFTNMVFSSIGKQSEASTKANFQNLLNQFYNPNSKVTNLKEQIMSLTPDAATVEQAKKDTEEGGYWSPEKTAERILGFAKAISGGDPSKIDTMEKAFEKGYKKAEDMWGDKLPQISKDTYDLVKKGFEDMREAVSKG